MKILVNMATITLGGGLQASRSFVSYCINSAHDDIDFHFVLSPQLHSYLDDLLTNVSFSVVNISPARFLRGQTSRNFILKLESQFRPDLVYSIGFPSYINFHNTEIGRYTNPWEIYSLKEAWSLLSFHEKVSRFVKSYIRRFYAGRASFFETQTSDAASAISKALNISLSNIHVSPNVINPEFQAYNISTSAYSKYAEMDPDLFSIFVLSADHKHKNLDIIAHVAQALKGLTNKQFTFYLTIPFDSETWRRIALDISDFNLSTNIVNLGPLTLDECLTQFQRSNLLFLPTLAEIFSSSYIEAMSTYTPIVTSDLYFARNICGDSALYFQPKSPSSAAQSIFLLMQDSSLCTNLINHGQRYLADYPSLELKYDRLIEWFRSLL